MNYCLNTNKNGMLHIKHNKYYVNVKQVFELRKFQFCIPSQKLYERQVEMEKKSYFFGGGGGSLTEIM